MRIIAGRFKGRRLESPPDAHTTRPIPDRVKESLFGMLRGHCEGASVLDAFAGTGSIGIEALSRGAARCVFFEHDRRAHDLLRRNVEHCTRGPEGLVEAEVVRGDALGPALLNRSPRPLTLAFFDPPYPLVRDHGGLERVRRQLSRVIDLLTDEGFAVLRTPWPLNRERYTDEHGRTLDPVELGLVDAPAHGRGPGKRSPNIKLGRVDRREYDRGRDGAASGGRGAGRRRDHDAAEEVVWEMGPGRAEFDAEAYAEDESTLAAELDGQDGGAGAPAETTGLPPGVRLERMPADLSIENAEGPETHVYGNTALHLYARKRVRA